MMICDVMCSAESEYVIYFLLAAYLETTHFGGMLPEWLTKLPLGGFPDVEARFQSMMACKAKFAWPSARSDEKARDVMQEAMQVFETAFVRLNFLKRMRAAVFMVGSPAESRLPDTHKDSSVTFGAPTGPAPSRSSTANTLSSLSFDRSTERP